MVHRVNLFEIIFVWRTVLTIVRYLFEMPNDLPIAGWKDKILLILRRRTVFVVEGESMSPTLKSGDKILVNPFASIGVGDIVLAQHPYKQSSRLVKRVTEISPSGEYFIAGDNPDESTDSRTFGSVKAGNIIGKVVAKLD